MRSLIAFLALTVFLLPVGASMPASARADVMEKTLKNGLKVIVSEDHKSPLAVFQIWYGVGSRDEGEGKTGASHLLEHMMFKGTPTYPSKVISRTVQKSGGTDNAFTTKDYTMYFQILPSDKIELSFQFESDRMKNLSLSEKETLSERDVVMEERRMRYDDDPRSLLYEDVLAAAFKVHPYRGPIIGWMSDIARMTRDDLYGHYRRHYAPNKSIIIVAGDVKSEEIFRKAEAYFAAIEPGPQVDDTAASEPPQRGERRFLLKKEAELPYLIAAYHVPVFPDEDCFALEVLSSVLSGKSGRLYKSLIYEKKIALSSSANYNVLQKDPYLFILDAGASPVAGIGELEAALYAEIEALKKEPPTDFEVQKAKNRIEASFIMGQDAIFFQAQVLGWFEMAGDWRLIDKYLDGVRKVTPQDVMRVAAKYLHEDNRTVGILIPEKK